MRNVTVKYLRQNKRTGSFEYRRRVPKVLEGMVDGREFLKVLGKSQTEAILHYGNEHERIEHLVRLAKHGVAGLSPIEQNNRLRALLKNRGADPDSCGLDGNERTWREEAAAKLVHKYQVPKTGKYVGVPEDDGLIAGALLAGVTNATPRVTVTDAFAAYLVEHAHEIPEQRTKQAQRFRRSETNLISVLKGDKALRDVTRVDARAWRDLRAAQVSPSTVRRERNDIGAVFSWAMSEMEGAGDKNPFRGMKLESAKEGRHQQRLPLDQLVINNVYNDLQPYNDLLHIWTLLDHTGARDSEIRMLLVSEVVVDDPVPHIVIQPRTDRTLKSKWSERRVPLVGKALGLARALTEGRIGSEYLFPRYATTGGLDRLSQALNKRIRAHTGNPKHVAYSLRHNMKDRMRLAEVFPEKAKAIEGHSFSAGQDGSYGTGFPLETLREALEAALKGYCCG